MYTYYMKRLVIIILILFQIVSCEYPDYFAEYKDSAGNPVNLIDGFVLPSAGNSLLNENANTKTILIEGVPTLYPSPNSWQIVTTNAFFEYIPFDYDGIVSGSPGGDQGPENGTNVYSIEVADLTPTGMFSASFATYWTPNNGPTYDWNVGNSEIDFTIASNQGIEFLLTGANGLLDHAGGSPAGATYSPTFDVRYTNFKPYADNTSWLAYSVTPEETETFYLSNFNYPSATILSIGAPGNIEQQAPNSGSLLDLRIARTDLDYKLSLFISQYNEGRPPLINGKYRFSLWVKTDLVATTNNAETVTLGINAIDSNSGDSYSFYIDDKNASGADLYADDWASWTLLSFETSIEQSIQIANPPASDYPVMELTISPTAVKQLPELQQIEPGVILFSSPKLEFITE